MLASLLARLRRVLVHSRHPTLHPAEELATLRAAMVHLFDAPAPLRPEELESASAFVQRMRGEERRGLESYGPTCDGGATRPDA